MSSLLSAIRLNTRRAKTVVRVLRLRPQNEMSIANALAKWAEKRPNDVWLLFEDQQFTFSQIDQAVTRRAAVLQRQGIHAGHTVSLMMGNRPELIVNALALNRLGAAIALINTSLRTGTLRHAVTCVRPSAAIVGPRHLHTLIEALGAEPTVELPIFLDRPDTALHGLPGHSAPDVIDEPTLPPGIIDLTLAADSLGLSRLPNIIVRGTDLYCYLYTSGTTGLPKAGRILNSRAVLAAEAFGGVALGLTESDTLYNCLPLFHGNGFAIALGASLWHGARLALARKFSVNNFWNDIRRHHATVFIYIGEICRYLLQRPPDPRDREHSLRAIAGNGMRADVWQAFVTRHNPGKVHEFYAATEGNVNMVNFTGRVGSVGKMPPTPLLNNALLVRFDPDTQLPVRDASGRCVPCQVGEVGELLGRINPRIPTQRFDGYADKKATEAKILHDVRRPGDAWFRSGDLLRQDRDGYFYFVDRIGDTYRWKGENISTNEVSDALMSFPGMELCNVYGVQVGRQEGRAGMAALMLRPGETFDPAAFYEHATKQLAPTARPAFLRLVDQLEMTATFKLRKVDLVAQGIDPAGVKDTLYYRDDILRSYRPLDDTAYRAIIDGAVRL